MLVVAVSALLLSVSCSSASDDVPSTTNPAAVDETTTGLPAVGPTTTTEFPVGESTTTTTTTAPLLTSLDLDTTMETPEDLPGYHLYRPADLDAIDGPMPVISWANGGCIKWDGLWQPLLTEWAASGLMVIAITNLEGTEPDQSDPSTAEDQLAALDWAVDQNQLPGGLLEGRVDVERMAVAGNSCGGVTTIGAVGLDDRVAAAFVLSGSGAFPGSAPEVVEAAIGGVHAPIAYVAGGPEDIARGQIDVEYGLLAEGLPAVVALRSEGDHPMVSTTESILTGEVADVGIHWFDLVFNGNEAALTALADYRCPDCPADRWTTESKNLESLVSD